MSIYIKGLTRFFARSESYVLELEGYDSPMVVKGCDVVRSNSYVELMVCRGDLPRLLVTIPLTDRYMQRCLGLENSIARVASTLFTTYRIVEARISSSKGSQLARVVIQQLPEGELLSRFIEGASGEQIQNVFAAVRLLDRNLRESKASFTNLNIDDLIVGDDALLYPFRYYRLRIPSDGGCSSLMKKIEEKYGVEELRNVTSEGSYLEREQYEGHLYSGTPHEDRVVVEDVSGYGFVDGDNCPKIESLYIWADSFREGRAEVESEHGFGLIDTDGGEVIPAIYESLGYNPDSGITAARLGGKWAYFSYNGEQLTPFEVDYPDEELTFAGLMTSRKECDCEV